MTAPVHCRECRRRIGKRGHLWAFGGHALGLCQHCTTTSWSRLHAKYFPHCRQSHTPADHNAMLVTPAGYTYLQANPATINPTSKETSS